MGAHLEDQVMNLDNRRTKKGALQWHGKMKAKKWYKDVMRAGACKLHWVCVFDAVREGSVLR